VKIRNLERSKFLIIKEIRCIIFGGKHHTATRLQTEWGRKRRQCAYCGSLPGTGKQTNQNLVRIFWRPK